MALELLGGRAVARLVRLFLQAVLLEVRGEGLGLGGVLSSAGWLLLGRQHLRDNGLDLFH